MTAGVADAAALVLYAVFAAVAFGWRTWVQWRRTGDTGLRLHARPGTRQWWAKLGFVAALAAGVAAPMAGLAGLDPLSVLDHDAARLAGTAIVVGGIAATVVAQWHLGASWRIGVDPTERTGLVTDGIYASIRNPIFTAMGIVAIGMALLVGNALAVGGLLALVAALQVQVRLVEEPYLQRAHGPTYAAYAAVAGRFLPGVGRLRLP